MGDDVVDRTDSVPSDGLRGVTLFAGALILLSYCARLSNNLSPANDLVDFRPAAVDEAEGGVALAILFVGEQLGRRAVFVNDLGDRGLCDEPRSSWRSCRSQSPVFKGDGIGLRGVTVVEWKGWASDREPK